MGSINVYQANNHINQIGIIKLFQISPEKEKKKGMKIDVLAM